MKTLKIALMTISVSVLCASCGTNQLESAANKMEKAVEKGDKAAVVAAMKSFELAQAQNAAVNFVATDDFLTDDNKYEIIEFVSGEMTKKYGYLVDDYESCVDDYVELLADINKGKTDKIAKVKEVLEKMNKVAAAKASVQKYFNEELNLRIEKADALMKYAENDVFKAAVYQIEQENKKAESASTPFDDDTDDEDYDYDETEW
ncbi:MAG: hypothetical protein ACI392_04880 [Paludibacteraceae bacterium]